MDVVDPRVDTRLVPEGSRAIVIAERQDEYRDLPSVRTPNGYVITRWSLSDQEREAILAFVARVNARAEADMLAGNPITGAHHRALETEVALLETA